MKCLLKFAVAAAVCVLHGRPLFPHPFCTPATPAQTKEGQVANSLTSMEFKDIMQEFRAIMESPESYEHLERGEKWLYSYDNDKIHQGADLEQVGFTEEDRYSLPALSSDMHKVIENVHAWLQQEMEKYVEAQGDEALEVEECKQHLRDLFDQYCEQDWVQANVLSLPDTYNAIIIAGGGCVPARYR